MALIYTDGFDSYSSRSTRGWTFAAGTAATEGGGATTPRVAGTGQHAYNFSVTAGAGASASSSVWRKQLPTTATTIIVGFALQKGQYDSAQNSAFFEIATAAGVTIVGVRLNVSDVVYLVNSAGTTIATGVGTWGSGFHYLELKLVINGASGSVEMRRDGVVDIGATTVNIGSTAAGQLVVVNRTTTNGQTRNMIYDDLYVVDNTGSAPRNTYLGDVVVETLYPSGAGNTTGWTPLSGANYTNVDDISGTYPDGDTTYVAASAVGTKDTYAFTDLVPTTATIFGASVLSYLRKDDAVARTVCPVIRKSGTDYDGTAVAPSTSYATFQQIYEQDPTAADWTVSVINAAEFGAKVVT